MTLLLGLLQVVLVLAVASVALALVVAAVLAVNGRVDARELLRTALGEDGDRGAPVLAGADRTAPVDADSGVAGVRERLRRPAG